MPEHENAYYPGCVVIEKPLFETGALVMNDGVYRFSYGEHCGRKLFFNKEDITDFRVTAQMRYLLSSGHVQGRPAETAQDISPPVNFKYAHTVLPNVFPEIPISDVDVSGLELGIRNDPNSRLRFTFGNLTELELCISLPLANYAMKEVSIHNSSVGWIMPQIFVGSYTKEKPSSPLSLSDVEQFYNITMTYSQESQIGSYLDKFVSPF